jgi:hypothetical protein
MAAPLADQERAAQFPLEQARETGINANRAGTSEQRWSRQ